KMEKQQIHSQDSKLANNSSSENVSWADISETNAAKECNVRVLESTDVNKQTDNLHVSAKTHDSIESKIPDLQSDPV
ncbi:14583_t:CDS:1, partial [Dentiscutata erythropus]